MSYVIARRRDSNTDANRIQSEDRSAHDWYRFVLSFPPHLVRQYLERFGMGPGSRVLDPFCGTGTTAVECKKRGLEAVGIEGNPMAHYAASVKTDWSVGGSTLLDSAERVADAAAKQLDADGVDDESPLLGYVSPGVALRALPQEQASLLLTDSISPLPLHKTLVLLGSIREQAPRDEQRHLLLALAKTLVNDISNLHFGPEVGIGRVKADAPAIAPWLANVRSMAEDLDLLGRRRSAPAASHLGDARNVATVVGARSIDAVITSPPYPNEKDYTRTTRLESVLLGFIRSKEQLRAMKKGLIRSNTRGIYKDDCDDAWVSLMPEVQRLADVIEKRRIELGKTSGFERLYARATRLYFGGMARHLSDLRVCLRPGAHLAYVVGDQASYFRVMIRTGQILADIARGLGYDVVGIGLFRTRISTATREQMREEVVVLRWPG